MSLPVLILCLKIFFSRILDVSLGTVRSILVVRGRKFPAAAVGFVEVFLWFVIAREALTGDVVGILPAIAYAGGYAAGTFLGGLMADRFIHGKLRVQIVTSEHNPEIEHRIREAGYALVSVDVNPSDYGGARYMLLCEIESVRLRELEELVRKLDAGAFLTVSETKVAIGGFFK